MRSFNRGPLELRPVQLLAGVARYAEGSAEVRVGHTLVRVTCSVEDRVPPHLLGKNSGWVTAEYGMLPRATHSRSAREAAKGKQTGRTQEIQRLIGRALRASVDLPKLGPRTFTLDCDVLEADGGTRCASITGAYIALVQALKALQKKGVYSSLPPVMPVAAVSVGVVGGALAVDLDYEEDSSADVDMNVVATAEGHLVEVQGTAEHGTFARAQLDAMVDAGLAGVARLVALQRQALG
jgi:ribonuclease PH